MLSLILTTVLIMLLLLLGMSIGVIMGRRPITGSCGGMKALSMDTACEICGDDPAKCSNEEIAVQRFSKQNLPTINSQADSGSSTNNRNFYNALDTANSMDGDEKA